MDKIKERGVTVAFGKVEAGTVKKGDSLMIMPGKVMIIFDCNKIIFFC